MAEILIAMALGVVVLKFAWDHLILPVTDNILSILAHLKAEPEEPPEREPAIGFLHFGDPDDDDYDDEEDDR